MLRNQRHGEYNIYYYNICVRYSVCCEPTVVTYAVNLYIESLCLPLKCCSLMEIMFFSCRSLVAFLALSLGSPEISCRFFLETWISPHLSWYIKRQFSIAISIGESSDLSSYRYFFCRYIYKFS